MSYDARLTPTATRWGLVAVCGGTFLALLDTTIVNVGFPSVVAAFPDAGQRDLAWMLDGYFVAIAALLVPAGGIADHLGRRRVFQGGLVLFTVASVLCALAPTWQALVAARVLQGVGAAVLIPTALALLLAMVEPARRTRAVGLWGAAAALAAAAGPPLGGAVVEFWDWRWMFLVNVPVGLALLVIGRRQLPESRDPASAGLPDLVGAALVAGSLGAIALLLIEGRFWGWTSLDSALTLAAAIGLGALAVLRSSTHPRPAVPLELFADRAFRWGTIGTTVFAAAFFSMILANVLYLTQIWGYSPLHAGLGVVAPPLVVIAVSGAVARLTERVGFRPVVLAGALVYSASLVMVRRTGLEPDFLTGWLPWLALTGLGVALAFPTLGAAAVSTTHPSRFGIASAVNGAGRQVGAVLGVAVLISILGEPTGLADAAARADDAYLFGIAAGLLTAVLALGLPGRPGVPAATGDRPVALDV